VPGYLGRVGQGIARRVLPGAVYRLAAGAAGVGVLLTPVTAVAAHPNCAELPSSAVGATPVISRPTPITPSWPTDRAADSDRTVSSPAWPVSPVTSVVPARPSSAPTRTASVATRVVVRPGDSLWSIADAHLAGPRTDSRVAAAWPRWYAANRHLIGADPDHIDPGQILRPPREGTSR
jgi:hypothetical protein